jgi:hypothetical protein
MARMSSWPADRSPSPTTSTGTDGFLLSPPSGWGKVPPNSKPEPVTPIMPLQAKPSPAIPPIILPPPSSPNEVPRPVTVRLESCTSSAISSPTFGNIPKAPEIKPRRLSWRTPPVVVAPPAPMIPLTPSPPIGNLPPTADGLWSNVQPAVSPWIPPYSGPWCSMPAVGSPQWAAPFPPNLPYQPAPPLAQPKYHDRFYFPEGNALIRVRLTVLLST